MLNKHFTPFLLLLAMLVFISCSKDSNEDSNNNEQVVITVSDFSISFNENPIAGQVIGTIDATSNQASLLFSITSENPVGALSVSSSNGQLSVGDPSLFDYETNQFITATVSISSQGISESVDVQIELNDIEENQIYEGDLFFNRQSEIDEFGSFNYIGVNGTIVIGASSTSDPMVDFSGFNSLIYITENLTIQNNDSLNFIDGFESLEMIGSLLVFNNSNIEVLFQSNHLIQVNQITIKNNSNLMHLSGLESIEEADIIKVEHNPQLENLNGLTGLSWIKRDLTIFNNDLLENLEGLENLMITGNANDPFAPPCVISIAGNDNLISLEQLSNLMDFNGILNINENQLLSNLIGLTSINELDKLFITNNPSLNSLVGLQNLAIINEEFHFEGNVGLTDLGELNNLDFNDNMLAIRIRNTNLSDLSILETIDESINSLQIFYNQNLQNLDNLSQLRGINANLMIDSNFNLTDLCGLTNAAQDLGIIGNYIVSDNAFNPTRNDLINGNCSI